MTMSYDLERHNGVQESDSTRDRVADNKLLYGPEDNPSPWLCFVFGLQQAVMAISGSLTVPFVLVNVLCAGNKEEVMSQLMSISMFMCGVATVMQSMFGSRLGLIQGSSFVFVPPVVAMMSAPKWSCPGTGVDKTTNGTAIDSDLWKDAMREIQGNLILASLTEMFLGLSGSLGFLLRFIGPLTVAPTISLIGLSLTGAVIGFCQVHWGVAFSAMFLTLVFALYLRSIKVPIPTRSDAGWQLQGFPFFQLFPVIFSIGISWIFCVVLTVTDTIPNNTTHYAYMARTDARSNVLEDAPWFFWPYPFPYGMPTVSAAGFVGFLAATIASIIESVGDYHAAAGISGAPHPPAHAVNRGIAMEGFASVISGMVGAGHGTTSYSQNIGAIGITKVGSRRVFITAGFILILCGLIGKFGAILSLIPDPVVGGTLAVVFGMVASVGMSTLKFIDLDSTRNLTILGVSFLMGLMIPQFVNDPKNANAINTGNAELDQMIKVLCGTSMLIGGVIGFILDNTVPDLYHAISTQSCGSRYFAATNTSVNVSEHGEPGTDEERGILSWRQSTSTENESTQHATSARIYDFPYVMKYIRRMTCCSYIPVCPTFDNELICNCCRRRATTETSDDGQFDTTKNQNGVELKSKNYFDNIAVTSD